MESQCHICGSKFPTRQCYFCQRNICTSCIVPEDVTGNYSTTKCITCDRRKINKISILSVLRRNKFILGVLSGFWIYTVFPLPFLQVEHTIEFCIIVTRSIVLSHVSDTPIQVYECLHSCCCYVLNRCLEYN